MPEKNYLSIQQIADKAGVSKATVSRVLRDLPGHKKETRERIIAAAKDLGYKSHPILSALMSSVRFKKTSDYSPVIAEIHCQPWKRDLGDNMISLKENIKKQAEKRGYRIEEFHWYNPDIPPKRLLEILRARGIRGILLEYFTESKVDLSQFDFSQFAVVSIGGARLRPRFHRVEVDHYGNLIKSINKLQTRGYQRFGVMIPKFFEKPSEFKRDAALYSVHNTIAEKDRIPMYQMEEEHNFHGLEEWIETHKPDCVLGVGEDIPAKLESLGYRIPSKVGYAHLGWHSSYKGMAGMNPNWGGVGITSVNLVIDQLNQNKYGYPEHPTWVLIEGEWVDGESVRHDSEPLEPVDHRNDSDRSI